jgi:endonuclease III related protein
VTNGGGLHPDESLTSRLLGIYDRLLKCYGPQHWWPAEEPFEVIVGAILTQSAAWTNVEKSIRALKQAQVLSPASLRRIPQAELAGLIHSCGYYNAKAVKLKSFAIWLADNYGDSLTRMFAQDTLFLRTQLLKVHGIGEETSDSILLYAGNKPVFVIDAYTRRIIDRHEIRTTGNQYADYQKIFMSNLSRQATLFNEYHALLVHAGKDCCHKSEAYCSECCLQDEGRL